MKPIAFAFGAGGKEFTDAILDALGMKGEPIVSLDLHFGMEGPLVVQVEKLTRDDQIAGVAKVIRRFEFVAAVEVPAQELSE